MLDNHTKKQTLENLLKSRKLPSIAKYYKTLEETGDLITNYHDYLTTSPIDVDAELSRLGDADYKLCAAFLTMILREDYFSNGAFEERYQKGQVTKIIERMIDLLG